MSQSLPSEPKFGEERRNVRIENVRLFEVVTNSDLCEGRGSRVSLGWFINKVSAKERARGAGVFGTDANIEEKSKWVLVIRRKRALAKLTDEDKEALGLSDK